MTKSALWADFFDFEKSFYMIDISKATHAANTRELEEEQRKPTRPLRKSPSSDSIKYSLGGTFLLH